MERTNPTPSKYSSHTSHSKQTKKKKNKEAYKPPKPLPDNEVIEITSDSEDGCTPACTTVIRNLRKEVAQLRYEKAKQKHHLEKYRKLLEGKLTVDASKVEEVLNCEICTERIRSPYVLSDCGHCFCPTCIQGWFRTTLNNFVPAFNAPRPQYSCPACRKIVTTRPVEVYTLKALVGIFASAAGDTSPQKDRNYNKALTTSWDQFFPSSH
ncbi:hypothetical protein M378DRAFT_19351 [Amanita muscaria Koide BX008]|uniref:RING-type domain-containing protein n=1 Tax=Amanita muscaria (strain Koide BX008) TaxID=946122 RepID=A0A0C2WBK5_AMAMK|nr:hypothetical protein M378DRAFT_19351 [Amanita muscaria Koide BX008]